MAASGLCETFATHFQLVILYSAPEFSTFVGTHFHARIVPHSEVRSLSDYPLAFQDFRQLMQVGFPGENLNAFDPVRVFGLGNNSQGYLGVFLSKRSQAA
jgi:hypothetical protein